MFNASAKLQNTSLNKNLSICADYLKNMVGIWLRFFREKFTVMADIEQMYHQIKVYKSDQDALKFMKKRLKIIR